MKVFISWSGEASHAAALALRDWLPSVLQSTKPYVSSEDIEKGARWSVEIGNELETTSFGILCVTGSNVGSPWLNFEAGALAKSMDASRVSPVLLGLRQADLVGPLAQFQATLPKLDDFTRLVSAINANSAAPIDESRLRAAVQMWWPQLEENLQTALKLDGQSSDEPQRSVPEMVVELLEIARGIQRQVVNMGRLAPVLEGSVDDDPDISVSRYEYRLKKTIARLLPQSWTLSMTDNGFGVAGVITTGDGRIILLEIKYGLSGTSAPSIRNTRFVANAVSRIRARAGELPILLVSNFPVRSEGLPVDSNTRWVHWSNKSHDFQLADTIAELAGIGTAE